MLEFKTDRELLTFAASLEDGGFEGAFRIKLRFLHEPNLLDGRWLCLLDTFTDTFADITLLFDVDQSCTADDNSIVCLIGTNDWLYG